jgi:hypothetical protein
MEYYTTSELQRDGKSTGLWHMTVKNSAGVFPVGYCTSCEGHATPAEAAEHYRQFKLDTARYDVFDEDRQHKCAVCGEWTQHAAELGGGWMTCYWLCDTHRTREHLEEVAK